MTVVAKANAIGIVATCSVIPAQAGIQWLAAAPRLDPGFRRDDKSSR